MGKEGNPTDFKIEDGVPKLKIYPLSNFSEKLPFFLYLISARPHRMK